MSNLKKGARGKNVVLCDGNEWLIPYMPVGPRGQKIAQMIDELAKYEASPSEERTSMKRWEMNFTLLKEILRVNYPSLTDAEAEELFDIPTFNEVLGICFSNATS